MKVAVRNLINEVTSLLKLFSDFRSLALELIFLNKFLLGTEFIFLF